MAHFLRIFSSRCPRIRSVSVAPRLAPPDKTSDPQSAAGWFIITLGMAGNTRAQAEPQRSMVTPGKRARAAVSSVRSRESFGCAENQAAVARAALPSPHRRAILLMIRRSPCVGAFEQRTKARCAFYVIQKRVPRWSCPPSPYLRAVGCAARSSPGCHLLAGLIQGVLLRFSAVHPGLRPKRVLSGWPRSFARPQYPDGQTG